jgi:hypothetical protein
MRKSILALLLVPTGCVVADGPVPQDTVPRCEQPTDVFDRFVEDGFERGVEYEYPGDASPGSCPFVPGGMVAEDMDADGDIDLLFANRDGFPFAYRNDGVGAFEQVEIDLSLPLGPTRFALGLSVVDLDGDGLPEVAISGASFAAMARNRGDFQFSAFEVIYDAPEFPRRCINALAWGDADGDGDLDLVLPTLDPVPYEGAPPTDPEVVDAGPSVLLLQADGVFGAPQWLIPLGGPSVAILAAFTDLDGDGTQEILLGADRLGAPGAGETALFQRTSGPDEPLEYEDHAAVFGLGGPMAAMGVDSQDINGDGLLDYCIGDALADSLRCLVSSEEGYVESARALGLSITPPASGEEDFWFWSTWSLEWTDLDNDGLPDLAVAGGPPPPDTCGEETACTYQPNAIFQGLGVDSWVERTEDVGWGDPEPFYGLAAADLEGDGYPELILTPWRGRPRIWNNPCGEAGWLDVTLRGGPGNRQGLGSRVTVTTSARVHVQEIHGPRVMGQSPALVHIGLPVDEVVEEVHVIWPDGAVSVVESPGPVGRLVVTHPELD